MAPDPVRLILFGMILHTLFFFIYDENIVEASMPTFQAPDKDPGNNTGFFDQVAQAINNVVTVIVNTVLAIWGVIVLVYNFVSFNVPDPDFPPWLRAVIAIPYGSSLVWSISGMIRGN